MSQNHCWVATRKGLFELAHQAGKGWQVVGSSFLGEPVSALVAPNAQGVMLAALNLGHFGVKVHASQDRGATWQEVATPNYPAQPAHAEGPPWKLVQIWVMERVGTSLWAGTLPGGLFRSTDEGKSWALVESLWNHPARGRWFGGGYDVPGIHSISGYPGKPDELLVGVSCGGVWRTTDGTAQWASRCAGMRATYMPPEQAEDEGVQDPHAIARCAAVPDVLWCQHHNGIWRSANNGQTWQEIEAPGSSFGFAVAAHPSDPNTAWFVPAQADQRRIPLDAALMVHRTRDAGQTFESLRVGLPQHNAFDLVYRHGLDVAPDGRQLAMGSTTGNLWISDDAGDHWGRVDANFPMIHAVRWG